jgi:hypothetical protein
MLTNFVLSYSNTNKIFRVELIFHIPNAQTSGPTQCVLFNGKKDGKAIPVTGR